MKSTFSTGSTNLKGNLPLVLLSLFCLAVTFPLIEPITLPGPDGSAWAAVNQLFNNRFEPGYNLTYSYGPLGFLVAPTLVGNNFELALIILSSIKFCLLLFAARYLVTYRKLSLLETLFLLIFLGALHELLVVFSASVLISLFLFEKSNKDVYLYISAAITAVALLVKVNYAFSALLIYLGFNTLYWISKPRIFVKSVALLVLFLLAFWISSTGALKGIPHLFTGYKESILGQGNALVLSPANNSTLLWLMLFALGCMGLLNRKDSDQRTLFLVLLLPLFACWKYSIGREDRAHLDVFVSFLLMMILLQFVVSRPSLKSIVLSVTALVLYSFNASYSASSPTGFFLPTDGIKNAYDASVNADEFKKKHSDQSIKNMEGYVLPDSIKQLIGNSSLDAYPWELSYVFANGLNYSPRPVIQDLLFSSKLDEENAKHFLSERAPQFILWETEKWGGENGGIDGKYLFNDEPRTCLAIYSRYSERFRSNRFILLERVKNLVFSTKELKKEPAKWGEWIEVPSDSSLLKTVTVRNHTSLLEKATSFIFKPEIS